MLLSVLLGKNDDEVAEGVELPDDDQTKPFDLSALKTRAFVVSQRERREQAAAAAAAATSAVAATSASADFMEDKKGGRKRKLSKKK